MMAFLNSFTTGASIIISIIVVIYAINFMTQTDKENEEKKEELRNENVKKEPFIPTDTYEYKRVLDDIAAELVNYRVKNEITTPVLAERLGASPEYIAQIEREELNLTLKELVNLVQKIGGSLEVKIHL
jgi:ribosome-binding protein aMBF1 (putative translation factor)